MRHNPNPMKTLAATVSARWDDHFNDDEFDKKWDRKEENAVMRAAKGSLIRDEARKIITALDRCRARMSDEASPPYEPEAWNPVPEAEGWRCDSAPAESPEFRQPPAEAGDVR